MARKCWLNNEVIREPDSGAGDFDCGLFRIEEDGICVCSCGCSGR